MKKTSLFLTALCALSLNVQANTADIEKGEHSFRQMCTSCHGKQAERSALGQSKIINKLDAETIVASLQARKKGEIIGAGNGIKARLSEQDMQNIAAYIQTISK